MARPTDWSALHGASDPVPGDPIGVSHAAERYATIAEAIDDAAIAIVGVFENDELKGAAIDAVREVALDVADRIGRAKRRYEGVGKALAGYVAPLEHAQRESVNLLNTAVVARDERHHAESQVRFWQAEYDEAVAAQDPAKASTAQQKVDHWQREIHRTNDVTTIAVNDLQAVLDARNAAANVAADAIELVENSGGLNDDFWDNVDQFYDEWKNEIDLALSIVGWVVAGLAVLAMFVPGLNVIVGVIVAIVAIVTIVNAVLQAGSGNKPLGQAVLEIALAIVPIPVGSALKSAFSSAAGAATTAATTSVIKSASGSGVTGVTTSIAASQVASYAASSTGTLAGSTIRTLIEVNALAAMPLRSGLASPVVAAIGAHANELFVSMVANEIAPPLIDTFIEVSGIEIGPTFSFQNSDW